MSSHAPSSSPLARADHRGLQTPRVSRLRGQPASWAQVPGACQPAQAQSGLQRSPEPRDRARLHAQARRRAHVLRRAALNALGQGWLAGAVAAATGLRRRLAAYLAARHTRFLQG